MSQEADSSLVTVVVEDDSNRGAAAGGVQSMPSHTAAAFETCNLRASHGKNICPVPSLSNANDVREKALEEGENMRKMKRPCRCVHVALQRTVPTFKKAAVLSWKGE